MMHILVDDREVPSGVIDVFKKYEDINAEVKRLGIGDYVVDNKILVERKTFNDFVCSIIDGRLFRQSANLVTLQQDCVLILEGDAISANNLPMSREAIQGALITVTFVYGIPILRAKDLDETVRLMRYIANQIKLITEGSLLRKGRTPKTKYKLQLHILQGLPLVGLYRAKNLLSKFGSVLAVINASITELSQVDGVGKVVATKIYEAVRNLS